MGSPKYFFKYGLLFASSATFTFAALAYFSPTPTIIWAAPNVTIVEIIFDDDEDGWDVPDDWNSANNSIEVIGAGGGGNDNNDHGHGGGGGAYAKITNLALTPGAEIAIRIGSGGNGGVGNAVDGEDTWFNRTSGSATTCTAGAMSVCAKGGVGAKGSTPGLGGSATNSIGTTKFAGGNGGTGNSTGDTGGGGGGAAAPGGAGKNGGNGSSTSGGGGGGGGGGAGGTLSTVGSAGSGTTGGAGGKGRTGANGPTNGGEGANGSGGGGGNNGVMGGWGGWGSEFGTLWIEDEEEFWNIGAAGGGGGGGNGAAGGSGGFLGGGGGGGEIGGEGDGGGGLIVVTYQAPLTVGIYDEEDSAIGSPGSFVVYRNGPATYPAVQVNVSFSGSAVSGVDYQPISSTVTIPANQTEATISVVAIPKDFGDPIELDVDINSSANYNIFSDDAGDTITIYNGRAVTSLEGYTPAPFVEYPYPIVGGDPGPSHYMGSGASINWPNPIESYPQPIYPVSSLYSTFGLSNVVSRWYEGTPSPLTCYSATASTYGQGQGKCLYLSDDEDTKLGTRIAAITATPQFAGGSGSLAPARAGVDLVSFASYAGPVDWTYVVPSVSTYRVPKYTPVEIEYACQPSQGYLWQARHENCGLWCSTKSSVQQRIFNFADRAIVNGSNVGGDLYNDEERIISSPTPQTFSLQCGGYMPEKGIEVGLAPKYNGFGYNANQTNDFNISGGNEYAYRRANHLPTDRELPPYYNLGAYPNPGALSNYWPYVWATYNKADPTYYHPEVELTVQACSGDNEVVVDNVCTVCGGATPYRSGNTCVGNLPPTATIEANGAGFQANGKDGKTISVSVGQPVTITAHYASGDTSLVEKKIILIDDDQDDWTVPADWNSANNSIEVIGGGGGGNDNGAYGQGGGGGAYAKITNLALTPGAEIAIRIGDGGEEGGNGDNTADDGEDTWFNRTSGTATTCTAGAMSVCAKGGKGAVGSTAGAGGLASGSIGSTSCSPMSACKYNGGNGGTGSSNGGSGGGGGAAGPGGTGKNGGSGTSTGGGGGGGAGGGSSTAGANTSSSSGGAGGKNRTGVSGPTNGGDGANGSGGGGGNNGVAGGWGGWGSEFGEIYIEDEDETWSVGAAGGGGGGGNGGSITGGDGGSGGGGGGGGEGGGGEGSQGGIVITYMGIADSLEATAINNDAEGESVDCELVTGNVSGSGNDDCWEIGDSIKTFTFTAEHQSPGGEDGSYWAFEASDISDGEVADRWGDNDATIVEGPGLVAGRVGQALEFNGIDEELTTANDEDPQQTFSLSLWFKTSSASGHKLIGFESSQTGESDNYDRHIYMDTDGYIRFGVYDGDTLTLRSSTPLSDNEWHHVVAVFDEGEAALYIDGELVDEDEADGAEDFEGWWRIGGYSLDGWPGSNGSGYFSGLLDEVRVHGEALSASEVEELYEGSGGGSESSSTSYTFSAQIKTAVYPNYNSYATVTVVVCAVGEQSDGNGGCVDVDICNDITGPQTVENLSPTCQVPEPPYPGECIPEGYTYNYAEQQCMQALPPSGLELTVNPPRVRKGESTNLTWIGSNLPTTAGACELTGNPSLPGMPMSITSGADGSPAPVSIGPINQTTLITLTCTNEGGSDSDEQLIGTVPVYQEI